MKKNSKILSIIFMVIGIVLFGASIAINNEDISTIFFIVGPLIFIISLISLIVGLVKGKKDNTTAPIDETKRQSIPSKVVSNNPTVKLIHYSGLNGVVQMPVTLELDENNRKLYIHANPKHSSGVSEFTLDLDKIVAAGNDVDIQYKQTSGVGRTVAGGLMFGAAGAVVGAVTKKDKKVTTVYKEIHYNSENGIKVLKFKSYNNIRNEMNFLNRINELINLSNANADGEIEL